MKGWIRVDPAFLRFARVADELRWDAFVGCFKRTDQHMFGKVRGRSSFWSFIALHPSTIINHPKSDWFSQVVHTHQF